MTALDTDTDADRPSRISITELRADPARWHLIDIREAAECQTGLIAGSVEAPLSLGPDAVLAAADHSGRIANLLVCASGRRCERLLAQPAFSGFAILEGGVQAWTAAGLPLTSPAARCAIPASDERYLRHHLLPQVGRAGQERLRQSKVTVIGAGGLGSPTSLYLAAAGVGHLRLIDFDRVDRSNLQRQVLHTDARVGMAKVESAKHTLTALNPDITVEAIDARLNADNAAALLAGADLIIDGADNFPTRYLLNDTALSLGIPWVYGAVQAFAGQVAVFTPHRDDQAPCYRCLFPEAPGPGEAPNCAEAGVLGALPGLIGSLQATEALKHLIGIEPVLYGTLLTVDALSMQFHKIRLTKDPDCDHKKIKSSKP
ncbi:molybdopterin biosynthesis protein MoeB [Ahniella affigens]|uniref:Molybdopterin-synthase adenylyltransferase n=1 Tax=Ahniella affigens TaxID=2021234 RepID=A0A2P1PRD5_9GAMM|nr:molybdopterin-synthase adenylyltransferase MoeB [Ahniella affigens]AVP97388.1 molybdopterin biosynthesis protein MoeB [Ahniella affigens]